MVQVAVGRLQLFLHLAGEHRQSREIMMAVSLHAADAERGTDSQVLKQCYGPDVRQVLAAHEERPHLAALAECGQQTAVGHALEDALAVLVAGACVAEFQCLRQAGQLSIGLIDDQARPLGPVL